MTMRRSNNKGETPRLSARPFVSDPRMRGIHKLGRLVSSGRRSERSITQMMGIIRGVALKGLRKKRA